MSSSLEPTAEQMAALAARPADTPVVMVNLLKLRADGGSASYARYAQEVVPHLQRVGGTSCMRAALRRRSSATAKHLGGTRFWSSSIHRLRHSSTW